MVQSTITFSFRNSLYWIFFCRSPGCCTSSTRISMGRNCVLLSLAIYDQRYHLNSHLFYSGVSSVSGKSSTRLCSSLAIKAHINLLWKHQANFPSLESLIAKIHEDGETAERALNLPLYAKYRDDPYLKTP